jgi:DNA-binding MarR family transcriptional regulator
MSRESLEELRAALGEESQAHQAAVDAVDAAAAARLGVNRTDLRCLEILFGQESVLPSRLGAALGLTTGSVTAMLDRLERLAYVTRTPDPDDRRRTQVRITPEAARLVQEIYGPIATEGADEFATYTAAELATILDHLRRARALQDRHRTRIEAMPPARRRSRP